MYFSKIANFGITICFENKTFSSPLKILLLSVTALHKIRTLDDNVIIFTSYLIQVQQTATDSDSESAAAADECNSQDDNDDISSESECLCSDEKPKCDKISE